MSSSPNPSMPIVWSLCAVAGLVLLAAGFSQPLWSGAPSEDDKATAAQFMEATRKMEQAASARSKEERAARMAAVREEYRQAREEAVALRSSKGGVAFWLKAIGGTLALVGCAGAYLRSAG